MSRGLGVLQRRILLALSEHALARPYRYQGAEPDYEAYYPLVALLDQGVGATNRSAARRAAHSLSHRGLLDVVEAPTGVEYRRGLEEYESERWLLCVRFPPSRWDPEIEAMSGSALDEHFEGIFSTLQRAQLAAEREVEIVRRRFVLRDIDEAEIAAAEADYSAQVEETIRTLAYHRPQLDEMSMSEPVGWQYLYLRHRAHRGYQAKTSARNR